MKSRGQHSVHAMDLSITATFSCIKVSINIDFFLINKKYFEDVCGICDII